MYAKMGMKHPKDAALDFGMTFFKRMAEKQGLNWPKGPAISKTNNRE
jgi:hypothetical protein